MSKPKVGLVDIISLMLFSGFNFMSIDTGLDDIKVFDNKKEDLQSDLMTFGIDQVDDTCFIAMELVAGEDLSERLARGALPVGRAERAAAPRRGCEERHARLSFTLRLTN